MKEFLEEFDDYYYSVYLPRHKTDACRFCHALGQLVTAAVLINALIISWWLLLIVPFVTYPFAIVGHIFEGKRPAFLSGDKRIFMARLSGMRMCYEWAMGKI